jgi:DNA repair protein RadC
MPEILKGTFKADSKEQFVVVFLDARHRTMAEPQVVSVGSLNASLVHPREVFGPALAIRAAAIVVAHNHPSGDLTPSGDDLELTQRLDQAGELLGIALLDHLIVNVGDIHGTVPMETLSIREYGWPSKAQL